MTNMASRKNNNTPSAATFADHEAITPPGKLRKALATDPNALGQRAVAMAQEWLQRRQSALLAVRTR
jgi:hypothetical protein